MAQAGWAWAGDGAACYEAPVNGHRMSPACYGGGGARDLAVAAGRPAAGQQQAAFQHSCAPAPSSSAAAARQLAMPGQYAAGASESGVTFGGGAQQDAAVATAMAPRKRKQPDSQGQTVPRLVTADVAAHFQQQLVDVDRLVLQHTTKMRAEMAEQRRRHARQVVAAVEAAAAKRLRAKDEEINRMSRLNWALEERVRSLYVEAQVWRDLAQSNEAAAAALRGELQQALDAQQQQAHYRRRRSRQRRRG